MTIKINYSKKTSSKPSTNVVLFTDEKFNINSVKNKVSNQEYFYLNDLLKKRDLKKSLLVFEVSSKKKIILISIKKNLEISDIENLGAEFHNYINYSKADDYFVNSDSISDKFENFIGHFLHGLKLKSYKFNLYKSKQDKKLISIKL